MTKITNFILNSTTDSDSEGFNFELLFYLFEVFFIVMIMYALVYLSFSIVKKSQIQDSSDLDGYGSETSKVKVKILMKNQIEMIQNGIVCIDNEGYIIPARRNHANHVFDDECPKIKHLNSLKYEVYDRFNSQNDIQS